MTAFGRPQTIVSVEPTEETKVEQEVKEPTVREPDSMTRSLSSSDGNNTSMKWKI